VYSANKFAVTGANEFANTVTGANEFANTVTGANEFANTVTGANEFANTFIIRIYTCPLGRTTAIL
jgi:hypothetical protein